MSCAAARVRARGRSLERRLRAVPRRELLAELRRAGALGPGEEAALGPPARRGWARRLRALALARGEETCRALLRALERLEEPGPLDFYNPRRDAEPSHRSDCPCCHPPPDREGGDHREEEDGDTGEEDGDTEEEDEDPEEEEGEDGDPEEEDEDPEEEEGEDEDPKEEDEDPKEEDGDEDEGPEEEGDPEEEEGGDSE
ncbi:S-antigen protein-like [Grus japonensis]|uniref:S-antigen protein-like n=1 Tax=Grus japonensis TaxID=30415 RepID=A0ABC9XZJ4_GRUJA